VVVSESLRGAHEDVRDAVGAMGGVVVDRHWRAVALPQFDETAGAGAAAAVAGHVWHPVDVRAEAAGRADGAAAVPTHFVVGSSLRIVNALCAVAAGCWLVHTKWALAALQESPAGDEGEGGAPVAGDDGSSGRGDVVATGSSVVSSSAGDASSLRLSAEPRAEPRDESEHVVGGRVPPGLGPGSGPAGPGRMVEAWLEAALVSAGPVPPGWVDAPSVGAALQALPLGRAGAGLEAGPPGAGDDVIGPGPLASAGGLASSLLRSWRQGPGAVPEGLGSKRFGPFSARGGRRRLRPEWWSEGGWEAAAASLRRLADAAESLAARGGSGASAAPAWVPMALVSSAAALRGFAAASGRGGFAWPRGVMDGWVVLCRDGSKRGRAASMVATAGSAWVEEEGGGREGGRAPSGVAEFARTATLRGAAPRVLILVPAEVDGGSGVDGGTAALAAALAAAVSQGRAAALRELSRTDPELSRLARRSAVPVLGVRSSWVLDVLSAWPPVSPLLPQYRVVVPGAV